MLDAQVLVNYHLMRHQKWIKVWSYSWANCYITQTTAWYLLWQLRPVLVLDLRPGYFYFGFNELGYVYL